MSEVTELIHQYLRHNKKFPHVFCPGCGRYAREMLDTVRRERFACFTVLAGLALLLGAFLGAAAGAWPALVCALGALSLFVVGRVKAARFDPNADARLRMGERSNELVILREEFEVVQELAREQGASLEPLEWRRAALRPYVLYTQPAAAA